MKLGSAFTHEPISVKWDRPAHEVATAIGTTVIERRYVDPGSEAVPFYRLEGSVLGKRISVRAKPYVLPGFRSGGPYGVPLVVEGELRDIDTGCELHGSISAPITALDWWLLGIASLLILVMLLPGAGIVVWLAAELSLLTLPALILPRLYGRVIDKYKGIVSGVLLAVGENRAKLVN